MLRSIKHLISELIEDAAANETISEDQLQIASAALLVEMMLIDNTVSNAEREMITTLICSGFGLSQEQAEELMATAEQQLEQATDYFQFTSYLNKGFSMERKIQLIQYLWEVAFADGQLDDYEDYMVRKVADLLYVPHSQMIKMRNHVKKALRQT